MKRIGVFCDVSNLYYCVCRKYTGRKLDYQKYYDFVKGLGEIQIANAYGSQMRSEAHKFIKCLKSVGFNAKFKAPKEYKNTKRKSDWDVGIAIDIVSMLDKIDTVILGSADSDMEPCVKYAMDRGLQVIVLACGVSSELHDVAHEVMEIPESMLEKERIIKEHDEATKTEGP